MRVVTPMFHSRAHWGTEYPDTAMNHSSFSDFTRVGLRWTMILFRSSKTSYGSVLTRPMGRTGMSSLMANAEGLATW